MASTRIPGITLGRDGRFFIDKRYRGVRIGMRLGSVNEDQAEQRLRAEMGKIDLALDEARRRLVTSDTRERDLDRPAGGDEHHDPVVG